MADDDDPFDLDFTHFAPPPAAEAPREPALAPAPPKPAGLTLEIVPVDAPLPSAPAMPAPEPKAAPKAAPKPEPKPEPKTAPKPEPKPKPLPPVAPPPPPPPPEPEPEPEPPSRYPQLAVPLALREAAELYASGKDMEATRRLDGALKGNEPLGDAALRVWQALFELLQALGRQQAFETLALAYAKRFELSPPAWAAPMEEDDRVSASSGGRAHVSLAGTLNAHVAESLKAMMKLAQTSTLVRIDLSKLTDADNDGATLLLRALGALRKAGREYLFGAPEHLADLLTPHLPMGERANESMWLLLLELRQQAWQMDAFEDAAVNYAVTFEVSPPSYVPPAKGATVRAIDVPAPARLALEGQLVGAGAAEFANLSMAIDAALATDVEEIDIGALGLARIDGASADTLRNLLQRIDDAGRQVCISGLSQLVAAFLTTHGVGRLAELRTRKA